MKKEWAKKWVKALRSGKYEQADSCLFDGHAYCCLGVLCKLAGREFVFNEDNGEYQVARSKYAEASVLPPSVKKLVGMKSTDGTYADIDIEPLKVDDFKLYNLAEANDAGSTFEEIADFIEKNYKVL